MEAVLSSCQHCAAGAGQHLLYVTQLCCWHCLSGDRARALLCVTSSSLGATVTLKKFVPKMFL